MQHQGFCSLPGYHHHCTIRSHSSSSSSTPTHEEEGSQQHQHEAEQPVVQPALTAPTSSSSQLASKPPAAAAGRSRQLASVSEQSGFVTLPPHATPSGYPESFVAGSSNSSGSSSGTQGTVPIEQVQLPQERLRIQLRQEVQAEEDAPGEGLDAYSLSRWAFRSPPATTDPSASCISNSSTTSSLPRLRSQLHPGSCMPCRTWMRPKAKGQKDPRWSCASFRRHCCFPAAHGTPASKRPGYSWRWCPGHLRPPPAPDAVTAAAPSPLQVPHQRRPQLRHCSSRRSR